MSIVNTKPASTRYSQSRRTANVTAAMATLTTGVAMRRSSPTSVTAAACGGRSSCRTTRSACGSCSEIPERCSGESKTARRPAWATNKATPLRMMAAAVMTPQRRTRLIKASGPPVPAVACGPVLRSTATLDMEAPKDHLDRGDREHRNEQLSDGYVAQALHHVGAGPRAGKHAERDGRSDQRVDVAPGKVDPRAGRGRHTDHEIARRRRHFHRQAHDDVHRKHFEGAAPDAEEPGEDAGHVHHRAARDHARRGVRYPLPQRAIVVLTREPQALSEWIKRYLARDFDRQPAQQGDG